LYTSDGVIWIYDLGGTKPIRKLTPGGGNRLPVWTADERVVFESLARGRAGLFWQRADGSTPADRLLESEGGEYLPDSVSPDGKTLFLRRLGDDREREIVTLSLGKEGRPTPLPQGPKGLLFSPSLSPDGRWLAYEWAQNVYVEPFPPTGARYPVTTKGGSNPMWSSDGKRLFYVREEEGRQRATFYSVEVLRTTGTSFENGIAKALFSVDGLFIQRSGPGNYVDLSPDGKQFVTLLSPPQPDRDSEQGHVNVVLNWLTELTHRAPVK
jgi:Tol biopolymer transport system component